MRALSCACMEALHPSVGVVKLHRNWLLKAHLKRIFNCKFTSSRFLGSLKWFNYQCAPKSSSTSNFSGCFPLLKPC